MPTPDEALRARLLAAFREEAEERMRLLAEGLARLRQGEEAPGLVEELFREVHSLKGAARVVNIAGLGRLCQSWESLFSALKRGTLAPTPALWELGGAPLPLLRQALAGEALEEAGLEALCLALEAAAAGAEVNAPEAAPVARAAAPRPLAFEAGSVRVPTERLDRLLGLAGEGTQAKLQASAHARELRAALADFAPLRSHRASASQALRQLQGRLEALPARLQDPVRALADYASWSLDYLDQWHFRVNRLVRAGTHLAHDVSGLTDSLQDKLQSVLLMPCQSLVEGLPAMTLELAALAGKQASLQVQGAELHADKRILDELKNPLEHLLRNAIDHGLETREQRLDAGKPAAGLIRIAFRHEAGDRFELCVEDDGRGFQPEALKAKALALGLMSPAQAEDLDEAALLELAFVSGLSTSPMLTELSGRGLGLAIVRDKIERLGGRVELGTGPGGGSRFRLHLPLSLATYRALTVRVAERLFALPATAVERALRLPREALISAENRPLLRLDDSLLPYWPLGEILGLGTAPREDGARLQLVVAELGGLRMALGVDEILGDQEITVRPLGRLLKRVRNVMGAAVLGDGRLLPLLHPQDLRTSALACGSEALPERAETAEGRRQRVLIAEDSFTSRGLLKSILESAGYEVMTASDGLEAWSLLKQGEFDLLVSDVEMPRLDGFGLTERLRADRSLADLPVVLVTALQSPEDRARGLNAGANAYIVKSTFEQDNLLDVVRRLL